MNARHSAHRGDRDSRFLGEGGGDVRPPDPRGGEGVVSGGGAWQGAESSFDPLLRLRAPAARKVEG